MASGGATAAAEADHLPRSVTARGGGRSASIQVDPHRAIVFPNRLRERRRAAGYPKLLALAAAVSEIPYIRLSKIERGEVFARADELVRIAAALRIDPAELLVDIDDPAFDMAAWAAEMHEPPATDEEAEQMAVMLGAALRFRRSQDRSLTVARLAQEHGLPAVIVSRIENAHKTLDRWNAATLEALCRLFQVQDVAELKQTVQKLHQAGELDHLLSGVGCAEHRLHRTRSRVQELRDELASLEDGLAVSSPPKLPFPPPFARAETGASRLLPVFGSPLPDGLIGLAQAEGSIEAPRSAGPRAFGLRVIRPTLGPGLPARATVVVDPDRFPSPGGLAVLREKNGLRLLSVTLDRDGAMKGYSEHPAREISLDGLDPAAISAVLSAVFE